MNRRVKNNLTTALTETEQRNGLRFSQPSDEVQNYAGWRIRVNTH